MDMLILVQTNNSPPPCLLIEPQPRSMEAKIYAILRTLLSSPAQGLSMQGGVLFYFYFFPFFVFFWGVKDCSSAAI